MHANCTFGVKLKDYAKDSLRTGQTDGRNCKKQERDVKLVCVPPHGLAAVSE